MEMCTVCTNLYMKGNIDRRASDLICRHKFVGDNLNVAATKICHWHHATGLICLKALDAYVSPNICMSLLPYQCHTYIPKGAMLKPATWKHFLWLPYGICKHSNSLQYVCGQKTGTN